MLNYQLSAYRTAREQPVDQLVLIGIRTDPPTREMVTEIYAAETLESLEWRLLGSKTGWFLPFAVGVMGC